MIAALARRDSAARLAAVSGPAPVIYSSPDGSRGQAASKGLILLYERALSLAEMQADSHPLAESDLCEIHLEQVLLDVIGLFAPHARSRNIRLLLRYGPELSQLILTNVTELRQFIGQQLGEVIYAHWGKNVVIYALYQEFSSEKTTFPPMAPPKGVGAYTLQIGKSLRLICDISEADLGSTSV